MIQRNTHRRPPRLVIAALALFFASAVACGDSNGPKECNGGGKGNTLSGSYCEGIEMVFTDVMLLLVASTKTLRIEYVNGDRTNKTLQLLVAPSQGQPLEPNREVNLVAAGAIVRRFTPETAEPINLTAQLEDSSNLTFSTYDGTVGTKATGEFNLLFKTGRTLRGEFDGDVVDAEAATGG